MEDRVGKLWIVRVEKSSKEGENCLRVGEYCLHFLPAEKIKRPLSFRVFPSVLEKFRKLAKERGVTQEELLKEFLSTFEGEVKKRASRRNKEKRIRHFLSVSEETYEVLVERAKKVDLSPATYVARVIEGVLK